MAGASDKSYHSVHARPAARAVPWIRYNRREGSAGFVFNSRGGFSMTHRAARPSRRPGRIAPPLRSSVPLLVVALLFALACGKAGEKAAQDVLHAIDQGKLIGTRGTMENIGKALTTYAMDRGGYPQGSSIQEVTAALVPAFLPSAETVDAWGNTLLYRSDTRSFTLTSPGADGRAGSADDLVLTDGRFTQLPAPPSQ
jgi:hypothetical protein